MLQVELRDGGRHERRFGDKKWIRPERIGARTARIGARSRRDGTARRWISGLTRTTRHPPRSCRTSPRRCATRPASCGRWCARRGWTGSAPSERSFDQKFVACPWDEVLDLLARRIVAGPNRAWRCRGLRRLLWLVQRRTFPPRAEPGSSLPEHRVRRLCALGEQLQRRRLGRDPAAYPRAATKRVSRHNVTWDQVAEHTDTVLAFGGMALKNSDVASGGVSRHIERDAMQKAARARRRCSTASRRCATTCRKRPARGGCRSRSAPTSR